MAGTAALRGSWEDPGIWGGRGFDFCFQSRSAPNPRVEIHGEGGAPASGTAQTGRSKHAVPEAGAPFARPVHGTVEIQELDAACHQVVAVARWE